jgi:outer membrane immunogenic protein
MRRLLIGFIAGISTFALAQLAPAADLPVKSPPAVAAPLWTGFYVGIEGGGAWGTSRHDFTGGTHSSFDVSGGMLGGTVGYNWQAGQFLYGIEGDLSWASSDGSTVGSPTACTGGPCTTELTWLGTIRGRFGYVTGMWMPFITGGVAFGGINACENVTCNRDTRAGWTVGGGVEAKLVGNWSVKAEYLYVDLGNHGSYFFIVPHTVDLTENIGRLGLNYKF